MICPTRHFILSPKYVFVVTLVMFCIVVLFQSKFENKFPSIIGLSTKETKYIRKTSDTVNDKTHNTYKQKYHRDIYDSKMHFDTKNNVQHYRDGKSHYDVIGPRDNMKIRIVLHEPHHPMMKKDPRGLSMSRCVYKNCKLIVSMDTADADAIIVQGNRPTKPLPVRSDSSQVFIFGSLEPPLNANYINLTDTTWNDYYNWSMTYRTDADIPYLYGLVVPRFVSIATVVTRLQTSDSILNDLDLLVERTRRFKRPMWRRKKNYSKIFMDKTVTAAWMVSHCHTASMRQAFVSKMKEVIDIDIYGMCTHRYCGRNDFKTCDKTVITQTKFYLAFENSLCEDYITEKVFKWFEKDLVVVVRGTRSYGRLLPRGTYIDADHFGNAHELALYLKNLGSNETAYVEYLKRKDMYKVVPHQDLTQTAYCNLCRKLNNLDKYRNTFDMRTMWTGDACIDSENIVI